MHKCLYIYTYTRNRVKKKPLIATHATLIYTYSYESIYPYHIHTYACINVYTYISIHEMESLIHHSSPHMQRSCTHIHIYLFIYITRISTHLNEKTRLVTHLIGRLPKNIGLFCKRALHKRPKRFMSLSHRCAPTDLQRFPTFMLVSFLVDV